MPKRPTALEKKLATELRSRLRKIGITNFLGFTLDEASRGRVVISLRVQNKLLQVHGVMHGGVIAVLADTAGGLASYMACPPGTRVATIEMKINYLEAISEGTVKAVAEVVRIGRHTSVVDCDITDSKKRLVGKALMTFFVGPFPAGK
jgi:uncharacterized protein (TIGR00369 family)